VAYELTAGLFGAEHVNSIDLGLLLILSQSGFSLACFSGLIGREILLNVENTPQDKKATQTPFFQLLSAHFGFHPSCLLR
jgi:hypothetical protein